MPQRRARPTLGAAALLGDRAHRGEVAVGQRGGHAHRGSRARRRSRRRRAARAGTPLQHERPRGEQQVDPLGDDQLADERDEAVVARVAAASTARAAAAVSRAEGRARIRGRRLRSAASRAASRRSPAAAASGPAGAKTATSTPGGPRRVRAGERGVAERRPQALGGVARADQHAAGGGDALVRVRAGSAGAA